jgi:hypothetical protein
LGVRESKAGEDAGAPKFRGSMREARFGEISPR